MPRQQFDQNPWIDPNADPRVPNPNYGTCPTVTFSQTEAGVVDVFVFNQGTGTCSFTLTYDDDTTADDHFISFVQPSVGHPVYNPDGSQTERVTPIPSGTPFKLDTAESIHFVATKVTGGTAGPANINVVGAIKDHITAASTNNDYMVGVVDLR